MISSSDPLNVLEKEACQFTTQWPDNEYIERDVLVFSSKQLTAKNGSAAKGPVENQVDDFVGWVKKHSEELTQSLGLCFDVQTQFLAIEKAYQAIHLCEYDVEKAVTFIKDNKDFLFQGHDQSINFNGWTKEDCERFEDGFAVHGKDFSKVLQHMKDSSSITTSPSSSPNASSTSSSLITIHQVIDYYYCKSKAKTRKRDRDSKIETNASSDDDNLENAIFEVVLENTEDKTNSQLEPVPDVFSFPSAKSLPVFKSMTLSSNEEVDAKSDDENCSDLEDDFRQSNQEKLRIMVSDTKRSTCPEEETRMYFSACGDGRECSSLFPTRTEESTTSYSSILGTPKKRLLSPTSPASPASPCDDDDAYCCSKKITGFSPASAKKMSIKMLLNSPQSQRRMSITSNSNSPKLASASKVLGKRKRNDNILISDCQDVEDFDFQNSIIHKICDFDDLNGETAHSSGLFSSQDVCDISQSPLSASSTDSLSSTSSTDSISSASSTDSISSASSTVTSSLSEYRSPLRKRKRVSIDQADDLSDHGDDVQTMDGEADALYNTGQFFQSQQSILNTYEHVVNFDNNNSCSFPEN